MQATIFAFGDSITHGNNDLSGGGWANRIKAHFISEEMKNDDCNVRFYELGVPGETTNGLRKRFKNETNIRLRTEIENVFIFAYGSNDSAFLPTEQRHGTHVDEFTENLKVTINEAEEYSKRILLLTTPPVDEAITGPIREGSKSRHNSHVDQYNQKIKELATVFGLKLVDVNVEFTRHDHKRLLSEDGLHPNIEGHQMISELVLAALTGS